MINILVVCTGNSCRSQMAHGWLKEYTKNINIYSAGISPEPVNPNAVKVMQEVGIDISLFESNHINDYVDIHFDYIFTVCDNAKEACPAINSSNILHHSFSDPAKAKGNYDEVLSQYRNVRDLLKDYFISFINSYFE